MGFRVLAWSKGPVLGVAASSSIVMLLILILAIVSSGPAVPAATTTVTQTQTQTVTLTATYTAPLQTVTYTTVISPPGGVEVLAVRFSPNGGCKAELLNWINRANQSIYVLIYSFTLDEVGDALVSAKLRGVDVKVVFDGQQADVQGSEYQKLRDAGVEARVDTRAALMHDKVAVIDAKIVITGSFNWSTSAEEENNENLIVLKSQSLASTYTEEFWHIWNTWT